MPKGIPPGVESFVCACRPAIFSEDFKIILGRGHSLLSTPGPVLFGTCICSTCWDQSLSKTCRILPDYALRTSLGTFLVGWLVLRINVDLAIFQPYLDLEAGDKQSLKIRVARPGIEPRSSCSASQELNHSATAAPRYFFDLDIKMLF